MKTRKGFVSNSSSASFVVRIKEFYFDHDDISAFMANEEDIKKLEEYGFDKSHMTSPFDPENKFMTDEKMSMRYHVPCNYEYDICFLVANNIPFKASCHYGHKYMSYKKDSDYIFEANNFGLALDMYGEDLYDMYDKVDGKELTPFRKIPKKEFLEENKEWEDYGKDRF